VSSQSRSFAHEQFAEAADGIRQDQL